MIPEQALALIEKYKGDPQPVGADHVCTNAKAPRDGTAAIRRLQHEACLIHAAAPCPIDVKHAMIKWWGPVICEYYSASEGVGFTLIDSEDWLSHEGSVGRPFIGVPKILDENA